MGKGTATSLYFLIAIDSPGAAGLAEELGQRLLGKQIVKSRFPLTVFDSRATLELPRLKKEAMEKIQAEISEWITWKHPALKMRIISGKRQEQNLGVPTEAGEEVVCLELRK